MIDKVRLFLRQQTDAGAPLTESVAGVKQMFRDAER
jgi:hypothetical protein